VAKDNLKNLKMVMAMMTANDESAEVIIPRAMKVIDEDLDKVQEWRGSDLRRDMRNMDRHFRILLVSIVF
jgi:hypothetical protein